MCLYAHTSYIRGETDGYRVACLFCYLIVQEPIYVQCYGIIMEILCVNDILMLWFVSQIWQQTALWLIKCACKMTICMKNPKISWLREGNVHITVWMAIKILPVA